MYAMNGEHAPHSDIPVKLGNDAEEVAVELALLLPFDDALDVPEDPLAEDDELPEAEAEESVDVAAPVSEARARRSRGRGSRESMLD